MTKTNIWMREYHRYLGFFLAGVMGMYAISGIILIFRETSFLKSEKTEERKLEQGLTAETLGRQIRIRDLKIEKTEGSVLYFKQGNYDAASGIATVTEEKLPFILEKMTKMHKATTKSPLFFFNIFFGVSLLFFVISSFYMFTPSSKIMKKGLLFSLVRAALLLIMLFV